MDKLTKELLDGSKLLAAELTKTKDALSKVASAKQADSVVLSKDTLHKIAAHLVAGGQLAATRVGEYVDSVIKEPAKLERSFGVLVKTASTVTTPAKQPVGRQVPMPKTASTRPFGGTLDKYLNPQG